LAISTSALDFRVPVPGYNPASNLRQKAAPVWNTFVSSTDWARSSTSSSRRQRPCIEEKWPRWRICGHHVFAGGQNFIPDHEVKGNVSLHGVLLRPNARDHEKQTQTKKSCANAIHGTSSKNGEEKAGPNVLAGALLLSSF
jgi:hypothetical protein